MSGHQPDLDPQDQRFVQQAKQALDREAAELDQATIYRLQRARREALETKPRWMRWVAWTSGLSVASVVSLAVVLWIKQPAYEDYQTPLLEDVELVTSAENIELAEDIEFYDWLADADTAG